MKTTRTIQLVHSLLVILKPNFTTFYIIKSSHTLLRLSQEAALPHSLCFDRTKTPTEKSLPPPITPTKRTVEILIIKYLKRFLFTKRRQCKHCIRMFKQKNRSSLNDFSRLPHLYHYTSISAQVGRDVDGSFVLNAGPHILVHTEHKTAPQL